MFTIVSDCQTTISLGKVGYSLLVSHNMALCRGKDLKKTTNTTTRRRVSFNIGLY